MSGEQGRLRNDGHWQPVTPPAERLWSGAELRVDAKTTCLLL